MKTITNDEANKLLDKTKDFLKTFDSLEDIELVFVLASATYCMTAGDASEYKRILRGAVRLYPQLVVCMEVTA